MIKLEDLNGQIVSGGFYPIETQIVAYNPEELFEVEKILKKKKVRGTLQYFVKWKGYGVKRFSSWIPASDLTSVNTDSENARAVH